MFQFHANQLFCYINLYIVINQWKDPWTSRNLTLFNRSMYEDVENGIVTILYSFRYVPRSSRLFYKVCMSQEHFTTYIWNVKCYWKWQASKIISIILIIISCSYICDWTASVNRRFPIWLVILFLILWNKFTPSRKRRYHSIDFDSLLYITNVKSPLCRIIFF